MINRADSERIAYLRFPLIVGVVFIHAFDIHGAGQAMPALDLVREVISQGLARVAVPLFFLMSGYFFFSGRPLTRTSYLGKLSARVHTLLIPLLFWNVLTLGIFALAQSIVSLRGYFSGSSALISDYGPVEFISAILGFGRPPIAYQFWFIRDLIVLAVFSPLLEFLLRHSAWLLLPILSLCWLMDIGASIVPSSEATLFFAAGSQMSLRNVSLFAADRIGAASAVAYPFLLATNALHVLRDASAIFHHITVGVGIVTAMYLTKFIARSPSLGESLLKLASASFFVYAAHEPLLTIVRKLGVRLIQDRGEGAFVLLYILTPLVLTGLLVVLYRGLSKAVPSLLFAVSGGRK